MMEETNMKQSPYLNDYLEAIHEEYVKARSPICRSNAGSQIKRGRSRTISGIAEDLFAELLCRELNDDSLCFFVDQALTCTDKSTTVYPDVTVYRRICDETESYEILYMLDLKMDVGFYRHTYLQKAAELMNNRDQLVGSTITGVKQESKKRKSDPNREHYVFQVNEKAGYDMVIITSKNSGNESELLKFAEDKSKNIWILSAGDHPNEYKEECHFEPRTEHWEELAQKIKEIAHA